MSVKYRRLTEKDGGIPADWNPESDKDPLVVKLPCHATAEIRGHEVGITLTVKDDLQFCTTTEYDVFNRSSKECVVTIFIAEESLETLSEIFHDLAKAKNMVDA